MSKVVYNACYGGFGLSAAGEKRYAELAGKPFSRWDTTRHDPALVQTVEELGSKAGSGFSDLQLEELPPGTKYRINEYDGNETVETVDNIDWTVLP